MIVSISTGVIIKSIFCLSPAGWLLLKGGTIGNAKSGATILASSAAYPIYMYLWNSYEDINAPVSGGRGRSARDDFDSGKTIKLLKLKSFD